MRLSGARDRLHQRRVLIMFTSMVATEFDPDGPLDQRRTIIRRDGDGVEMVELPWSLRPREPGGRPFTVICAEGRTFPSHRCLVPASEFRHRSRGRRYSFSLSDSDRVYFAGIWRPTTRDLRGGRASLILVIQVRIFAYDDPAIVVVQPEAGAPFAGFVLTW